MTAAATVLPAVVAGVLGLLATPYLARLTVTAPDREDAAWWRGGAAVSRPRLATTAGCAVVVGALAGAAARWSAVLPAFVALALAGAVLIVIDVEHHRLPDRVVAPAAVAAAVLLTLAATVTGDWHRLLRAVEGAAAVFAVLYAIAFVAAGSFGFGDVKLGGVLGGYLGWFGWGYVYNGVVGGFVLGLLVALVLLLARRASMKTAVAFGPMLLVGALVVLAARVTPLLS